MDTFISGISEKIKKQQIVDKNTAKKELFHDFKKSMNPLAEPENVP